MSKSNPQFNVQKAGASRVRLAEFRKRRKICARVNGVSFMNADGINF
jgi:hypothetical protein